MPDEQYANNLVMVDDSLILAMIQDPRFVQAFSCVRTAANQINALEPECRTCPRKRAARQVAVEERIAAVRQCVAIMPQSDRTKLTRLLSTRQVRVRKKLSSGKYVVLTY